MLTTAMNNCSVALCGFSEKQFNGVCRSLDDCTQVQLHRYERIDRLADKSPHHDVFVFYQDKISEQLRDIFARLRRQNLAAQFVLQTSQLPDKHDLNQLSLFADHIDCGIRDCNAVSCRIRHLLSKHKDRKALLDAVPDALVIADRTGKVTASHLPTPALLLREGNSALDDVSRLALPTWALRKLRKILAESSTKYVCERFLTTVFSGGDTRTFEWRICPVVSDNKALILIRDITDDQKAQKVREVEAERKSERERLKALENLTGGIAHDYNNLLVGVLGNADLALMHLPPDSPARKYVRRIEEAGVMAAELTKQMLAYAGKTIPDLTTVNMDALIHELIPLLKASLSSNITFKKSFKGGKNVVAVDMFQMRQVFMSIFNNSVEALDGASGTITVSTGTEELSDSDVALHYRNPALRTGTYAFFRVEDDGPGMDTALVDRVFDPFYTTKFLGRGLGLAAVLGIIRSHEGGVHVRTSKGQGFTITVYLPVQVHGSEDIDKKLYAHKASGKVLLIESDSTSANVARNMLEHIGYSVSSARGMAEARSLLSGRGYFGVIIVDASAVRLQEETGLQQLRETSPNSALVISSSLSRDRLQQKLGQDTDWVFLKKPYRLSGMITVLRGLVKDGS